MTLTLAQQIGHVGSELTRAHHWEAKQDPLSRDRALLRALELLDATLEDRRWRKRLKELARLREVLCGLFCRDYRYDISLEPLLDYCNPFARKSHG
ncbi:MAG: hypothetical protein ABH845_05005 [Candidatus Omnitrophota bacterium]